MSGDRLSKATADHLLSLVSAYGAASEDYGRASARYATARDAHRAVVTAILDLVDWRAVVDAADAARAASTPASGEAQ